MIRAFSLLLLYVKVEWPQSSKGFMMISWNISLWRWFNKRKRWPSTLGWRLPSQDNSGSSPPGFGTFFSVRGWPGPFATITGKKDTEKGIDLQTKALHFQHKTRLWFPIFFYVHPDPRLTGFKYCFYVHPDPWWNPILFTILLFDWYFWDGLVQSTTN